MKKSLALILAAILCLSLLAACGSPSVDQSQQPSQPVQSAPISSADPSVEPTQAPSAQPSEVPSAAPSEEPSQPATPAPTPTPEPTPGPTPEPTPEPTPDASASTGVDLAAFAQDIQSEFGLGVTTTDEETGEVHSSILLLDPMDETGAQFLENYFPGLTELDLPQCLVYFNRMSINTSELALVEASSAEEAAQAAAIFQARIRYMVGDGESPGGAWYPGPTEIWTNSSRVIINGNFVMMVVHRQCDDIADEFNSLF